MGQYWSAAQGLGTSDLQGNQDESQIYISSSQAFPKLLDCCTNLDVLRDLKFYMSPTKLIISPNHLIFPTYFNGTTILLIIKPENPL